MSMVTGTGRLLVAGTIALAAAGCATHGMHDEHAAKHEEHAHSWAYEGKMGPAQWASLKSEYATCGTGKRQSPVDLPARAMRRPAHLAFAYKATGYTAENNGHTLQYNVQPGSAIMVGRVRYDLVQFHFHTPSEYRIGGKAWPMELHLVHRNAKGQLAVVGVMVDSGATDALAALPRPAKAGEKIAGTAAFDPAGLLPANRAHYAFAGSLTTPPCSENVRWFEMRNPIAASAATIAAFGGIMGKNARPLQPLNRRPVFLSVR
ncbi:MAG: carbonic anhydrase family protein [Rhodospirillaceae bacterium]|nr:carbonic anhydrase family protein [Rhodospirillaceae bacterium]